MTKGLYIPVVGVNSFVVLGMFTSFFGPLQYVQYNKMPVFIFVVFFMLFFTVGYIVGVKSKLNRNRSCSIRFRKRTVSKIFSVSLAFSILFMTYEFLNGILVNGMSFNIAQSGAAYVNAYAGHERNSGSYSLSFLVLSVGSLPVFITQVWGILFFKDLSKRSRFAVIYVFTLIVLVYTVGGGKQKQFGDLIVYLLVIFTILRASSGKLNWGAFIKVGFLVMAGVYMLLVILAYRYQNIGINLDVLNGSLHPLIFYKDYNLLENLFGEMAALPMVMLSGYLGQGYYGLSLAFDQPFTWSQFGGASYSWSVILNRVFGTEFLVEQSYPYIVGASTGWAESKWHTLFSWLASDLTFPGTIVFLGVVGFYFGRTWKEALLYLNPFSILLVVLLCIGVFYIPANNQLMHSPGGLWTLGWVIFLYNRFSAAFNFDFYSSTSAGSLYADTEKHSDA